MRLYDPILCMFVLTALLISGFQLSCSKEPALSPAEDCAMRCWTDGQGAANYMDLSTDPPTCVCVPPLEEQVLATPAKVVACMQKCGRDTRDRDRPGLRRGIRICGICLVYYRKARRV